MNFVSRKTVLFYTVLALVTIPLLVSAWVFLQSPSVTSAVPGEESLETTKRSEQIKALVMSYSIDEAVKKSDLIAEIVIKNKVEEFDKPSPQTAFSAEVNNVLKGNLEKGSIINVLQDGNTTISFNGTPMFQPGESYVLMLMEAVGLDNDNTYWILGAETGIYQVVTDQTLMKWQKSEETLKSIEVFETQLDTVNEHISTLKEKFKDYDIQILQKDKFEELVESKISVD